MPPLTDWLAWRFHPLVQIGLMTAAIGLGLVDHWIVFGALTRLAQRPAGPSTTCSCPDCDAPRP